VPVSAEFLRKSGYLTGLQLAQKLVEFLISMVMARLLTPADFGIVAAAGLFIQLTQLLVEIGVGATIIQARQLSDRDINTAYLIVMSNGFVYFLLTQLCAPYVADFMGAPEVEQVLRVLAITFIFQSFGIVPESMLVRRFDAARVALVTLTSKVVVTALIGITLGLAGFGFWALIVPTVIGSLVKSIFIYRAAGVPFRLNFSRKSAKRVARTGSGFSLSRIINFAAIRGDNVFVARFFDSAALGNYTRAYNLMDLPATLYGTFADKMVFPLFAKHQADPDSLREVFARGIFATALFGIPLSIVLFVLGQEWIVVIYGDQWTQAVAPFQALAIATYFRLGMKVSGSLQRSKAATRSMISTQAFYAATVVVGSLVSYRYGLVALSVAVSIGVILSYIVISASAVRLCGMGVVEFIKLHLAGLLIGAAILAVTWPLAGYLRDTGHSHFTVLAINGIATVFVLVGLLFLLPAELLLRDRAMLLLAPRQWFFARTRTFVSRKRGATTGDVVP
jgi:PST family polysaccharide transporter